MNKTSARSQGTWASKSTLLYIFRETRPVSTLSRFQFPHLEKKKVGKQVVLTRTAISNPHSVEDEPHAQNKRVLWPE